MVTFIVGRHRGKIIQRVFERLFDLKIFSTSVLSFIGSVCAPDKATLKAENHALQCTAAGPYNATPISSLGVGSVCGLGPDLVRIHSFYQPRGPLSNAYKYLLEGGTVPGQQDGLYSQDL